ncbi:uncharacterized protein LOC6548254 [Drosophila erecta]|uniref:Ionotropic glutamate receptor C-terminal domain-containing protein n=1 Tax=Drosophila erecta TaxID=7220 RepID=B3NQL6_DROER|nr:uncharacterized protein LOC6548254 [Drosophila erecta]EDV57019.2 uncharacterized protein Dere_GG19919 [Drosophila erecta]
MVMKMFSFLLGSVLLGLVGAPDLESVQVQVLQDLNKALQTELNVFIDFECSECSSEILRKLDTPRVLLSSNSSQARDLRLRGNFTERALIIVSVKESGPELNQLVAILLPRLLHELHELHIVFLGNEEPGFAQQNLYAYCFKEGFVNVILLRGKRLHSYLPYPRIQPMSLSNVSEYLNRARIIRNFQGYPVRTLRSTLAPRDFEYFNDQGDLVRAGYLFTAVKELAYRYNATIESVPIPDLPEYEVYTAVSDMLRTKRLDIVCYFKDFNLNVAYTAPLSIIDEYFMAPHARPISSYLYYSKPFAWTLWVVVISTVLYGTLMLHLTARRARIEIGTCLLYSLSHILYNCHQRIRVAGWRDMAIHAILTIGGFILTNVYLATLSSILTSGLYDEEYNTLEDLVRAPYPSLHDDYYKSQMQKKTFLPERFRMNSMTLNATLLNAYRDGLNQSYIYMLYEDRLELILMQQYLLKTPRFNMIRQGVGYTLESYCVSTSLPYLELTSEFMRRLQEHGITIKIKADTFRELIQQGIYTLMRDDEPPAKAFDLDYYLFAFVLWAAGLGLSLLVFFVEFVSSCLPR